MQEISLPLTLQLGNGLQCDDRQAFTCLTRDVTYDIGGGADGCDLGIKGLRSQIRTPRGSNGQMLPDSPL